MSDSERQEVYAILRRQIGHDFSGYKAKTFVRRVHRRMQIVQLATVDAYVERLRADGGEVNALFRDLLINVTNFFRDRDAFQSLSELVIPKLFEGRGAEDTIRVWVPGCATGEEVYSIAILLREHMETRRTVPRVQIFATDIDERALGVARAARYPEQLLDSVSPERRRFFIPDGGSFVIAKEVRDLCIFSPHSVIRDPPFSRLDLVSCRNLLIYFGADAQSQVLPTFHYALKPGGYMFLGMAENVSQFADLFAPLDKKHRLFRSRERAGTALRLPAVIGSLVTPANLADLKPRREVLGGPVARQSIEAQVLDRFAPAHVVTNRDGEVVHYSNRTGKYLEAPSGGPSRQIVTMARRGLRLELRGALREAAEGNATVTREGVAVEGDDGRVQMVTLTVAPVADAQGSDPLYLILFADDGPVMTREAALQRAVPLPDSAMLHLERELRETRERLQSLVEEYETALEELKSSNEELVSVNEELQSTNEELEASKEELQSVNEELHTVNAELNAKVEALDRANADLQNLFESSDLATVFLDGNLVIRSFTPAVTTIFNVLPSDRGRPITDLAGRFSLPDLATDVASVIRDGQSIERRIDLAEDRTHYVMRFAPYRNGDGRIEGAVVTFLDVTSLTQAETYQRVLVAELQHRTRNLLGVVQSIANQTLGNGGSLSDYLDRLKALGRAQGLLSHSDDEPITIGTLVRLELEAMGAPGKEDRIHVAGPDVSLRRSIVQTLALGLHELATNAFKYGALANERGRLAVTWRLDDSEERQPRLVLDWVEQDIDLKLTEGDQVATRQGFGRELIERALPHDLGARTSYALDETGVRCRIDLPLSDSPGMEPRS